MPSTGSAKVKAMSSVLEDDSEAATPVQASSPMHVKSPTHMSE